MRDTFTNILPTYGHVDRTVMQPPHSHKVHPEIKEDIMGRKFKDFPREYNHKFDPMKTYSEEMYRLGIWAPQPIKQAPKAAA